MNCWHVFFSGDVQGVGFRYTAKYLASSLEITGWVRNLPDGRVELEACGAQSREFISRLEQKFNCQAEVEKIPGQNYSGFEIR